MTDHTCSECNKVLSMGEIDYNQGKIGNPIKKWLCFFCGKRAFYKKLKEVQGTLGTIDKS